MSDRSHDNPKLAARPMTSEPQAYRDFVGVDCAGLARAIELSASGHVDGDAAAALLRHEFAGVQRQIEVICNQLHQSCVELRQLRDSAQREQVQKQDEQRQLQDQNDRFVANLIHEHDIEKATLRRERDAAIDRVRELSRGIVRASSSSSASMPRVSVNSAIRSAPPPQDVVELKARIDELLYERDRSLRLLRQLAEQRDLAESRLQATMAALGSNGTAGASNAQTVTGNVERPASVASRSAPTPNPQMVTRSAGTATATPTPGLARTPASPAQPRPESQAVELAALEDPNNWEVGPPALAANTVPVVPIAPKVDDNRFAGSPEVAKDVRDVSGAYSLVAAELSIEEVHVSRLPRNVPKGT